MQLAIVGGAAINHGRSFTIASLALLVAYVLAYVFHAAVAGTFSLPPAVLAVLAPLTPIVDYVLAYVVHGCLTGEWSPPLPLPPAGQQATQPVRPPVPPVPPA